jgi:hypothetical protein
MAGIEYRSDMFPPVRLRVAVSVTMREIDVARIAMPMK